MYPQYYQLSSILSFIFENDFIYVVFSYDLLIYHTVSLSTLTIVENFIWLMYKLFNLRLILFLKFTELGGLIDLVSQKGLVRCERF